MLSFPSFCFLLLRVSSPLQIICYSILFNYLISKWQFFFIWPVADPGFSKRGTNLSGGYQLNPSCTRHIFRSIPVHPRETTVSIFKLAVLATQDSSPELICPSAGVVTVGTLALLTYQGYARDHLLCSTRSNNYDNWVHWLQCMCLYSNVLPAVRWCYKYVVYSFCPNMG